jgi:type I restriction enzyme, S subunit
MSFDWSELELGEIVTFKTGKLDSNAAEEMGQFPFFTCSPNTLAINSFAFDTEAVILAGNNANGVFSIKHYSGKFNAYQRTYVIEPINKEIVSCRYAYFLLSQMIGSLKELSIGSATKFLTKTILNALPVRLPPKSEQDEIALVLSTLDDRITLLRETNTTLEAIAQALFKSWFVDFDPVHAKMQGRAPEGMDEATAALFPDSFEESEQGPVPKGWRTYTVGELIAPKRGKSITKSRCIDGDVPVVAGGLEPAYFHNESNVSSPVVTISASGANAGFVRLYQQDIWASDCSFISKEQTGSIYFWYVFLKSNQENIYFMQQGAAQPHIYPSDLMRLNICMPKSNELSHLFHNFVLPLVEKIGLANAKIQTLSTLRDTLLPRLISGQLRIQEAQAHSEEIAA